MGYEYLYRTYRTVPYPTSPLFFLYPTDNTDRTSVGRVPYGLPYTLHLTCIYSFRWEGRVGT